jgi:hypothetical protein
MFGRDNKSGDFNLLIEVGLFACSLDGGRGEKREKNVAVNVQPPFKTNGMMLCASDRGMQVHQN